MAELRVKRRLPEEEPTADEPGNAAGMDRCGQVWCGRAAGSEGGEAGGVGLRGALVLQTCVGNRGLP